MGETETKRSILIVDSSAENRAELRKILCADFNLVLVEDGAAALEEIQQSIRSYSLVLLAAEMPGIDGFKVLEIMHQRRWIEQLPVVLIGPKDSPEAIERAFDLGVFDYVSRPFLPVVVRRRVANIITLTSKQKRLANLLVDQVLEKEKNSMLMVSILGHVVEFRNAESGLHVLHIRAITELLLHELVKKTKQYKLSMQNITTISLASALHDIGKIAIPEAILNKPGKLTSEEYEIMKTHAALGADMLQSLEFRQKEELVQRAYEICRWHHERYDGSGYPDGLVGEEIPIAAQVVSVADVYDALTSERVYKQAYSHKEAVRMIEDGECGEFNPLLLECLRDAADAIYSELNDSSPEYRLGYENERIMRELLMSGELIDESLPSDTAATSSQLVDAVLRKSGVTIPAALTPSHEGSSLA